MKKNGHLSGNKTKVTFAKEVVSFLITREVEKLFDKYLVITFWGTYTFRKPVSEGAISFLCRVPYILPSVKEEVGSGALH